MSRQISCLLPEIFAQMVHYLNQHCHTKIRATITYFYIQSGIKRAVPKLHPSILVLMHVHHLYRSALFQFPEDNCNIGLKNWALFCFTFGNINNIFKFYFTAQMVNYITA